MAEKINIASLTIDVNDVIKQSAKLKKQLDETKAAKKQLDTTTEEGQIADAKAAAEIKNLSKAYRDNQQLAAALDETNKDLNKTMSVQGKSTQQLRNDRAKLNQISKNIKGDTQEEIQQRNLLNQAIDEQTKAIRDQGSEFNAAKDQVGEYESNIISAFQGLTNLNGGIGNFIISNSQADLSTKAVTKGLGGLAKGFGTATKAALKFLATPVGIVLGAIAGAFALVSNAMNRSEKSTNTIKKAFSGFSGIISGLLKFLEPLGEFLVDNIAKSFEALEQQILGTLDAIAIALDFLGFEETAASLRGFNDEIRESAELARKLAEAEIELEKSQRNARKTQLEFQRDAEKLRQIRDDESKSIPERIRANEELGKVLKKQAEEELAIANKAVEVAELRIKLDGEQKDLLDELAIAQTEVADIQERITGQESEQLVNKISLQKEAAQNAIDAQKQELDYFIESQGIKAKSLEEELKILQEVSDKKIAILDNELKNKIIKQKEYDTEVLKIQNELLRKQTEIAINNARIELDEYINKNQSKLDSDKYFSEEAFIAEQERLNGIAEANVEFAEQQFKLGVINQQEYNAKINEINEENRIANEELEKEREESKKEKEAIDFENKLAIMEEQGSKEYETLILRLERERKAEVEDAEKTGADIEIINKKYAERNKAIALELERQRLQSASDTFGGIANILGEQTAAGKAAGIAQATINTYLGATEVLSAPSTLPEPVGSIAKGVAAGKIIYSGLQSVKKIIDTPTTYERGGILSGARHYQGGIDLGNNNEGEDGEAIINRRSTALFAPLLSSINSYNGYGRKFARGGILGTTTVPSTIIDYDTLADKMAEANAALPNPIVGVTEITEVTNRVNVIESDSDF